MGPSCTTPTSALAAATASGRVHGACPQPNGIRSLRRYRNVRTALTVPASLPVARNGQALTAQESQQYHDQIVTPACVKACPANCLQFGTREDMLQEAHSRISAQPEKYVDHIYGEKEAGGTSVLYLSSVSFDKLGFPDVGTKPYPAFSKMALHAVPPAVIAVGALLGGAYAFLKRRASAMAVAHSIQDNGHHVEFEPFRASS